MAEVDSLEKIIKDAEGDEVLKGLFGSNNLLSGGILNDLGSLMESYGLAMVNVRLRELSKDDIKKKQGYDKLYDYLKRINALEIRASGKGYIVKKFESVATVNIGG